jgi:hypothetical protein
MSKGGKKEKRQNQKSKRKPTTPDHICSLKGGDVEQRPTRAGKRQSKKQITHDGSHTDLSLPPV